MGACALVLCGTPVLAQASSSDSAERLERHVKTMRKDESVIRFFETHRWLLADSRFAKEASLRLTQARQHLAHTRAQARKARVEVAKRRRNLAMARVTRHLATLNASPRKAICHVFGNYCGQALRVARCESNYRTTAQNGQYLGLFQMGSSERRLFGHGRTPVAQARAAHRYFVRSGRDWSPWSCKPWY